MNLFINTSKGRKSVNSVDSNVRNKKSTLEADVEQLGLENFKDDLITQVVVHKSEQAEVLEKAGTKHLPNGARRYSYIPEVEMGTIYIPVNRLQRVYQTEDATDKCKVRELVECMSKGKKLPCVQIGYNYDIHDGHHRWEACKKMGYTHVPCEVVGTDKKKVAKAKKKYRGVWKSETIDLLKSLETSLQSPTSKIELVRKLQLRNHVEKNLEDEVHAVGSYKQLLSLCDPIVYPVIREILQDEEDHFENLKLVLAYLSGDISYDEMMSNLRKSLDLFLVVDLQKSGQLNKGKLVRKRVMVKGKDGKTFYRMQWVKPGEGGANIADHDKEEYTYGHDDSGVKEIERAQSNKFPVLSMEMENLKIDKYNYKKDTAAIKQAILDYHEGKPLPPVRITPAGEIIQGEEYYEMAKELKLTHIPVIVLGNPNQKKALEYKYRDQVYEVDEEGNAQQLTGQDENKSKAEDDNLSKEIVMEVEKFTKVTVKQYPKEYLMEQAKEQGVSWDTKKKDGTELPVNSAILWMRAHQAIVSHIKDGNSFEVKQDKKQVSKNMKDRGEDATQKAFLELLEKFSGNKQQLMEYMRENYPWAENKDPDINWMYCMKHAKKMLAQGKMVNGVRTRQKALMEKANAIITTQIRDSITAYGTKHGKQSVMERANTLGITWKTTDKKGNELPEHSPILWMRAHTAICQYVAEGKQFSMSDHVDKQGLIGDVGKLGETELTKWQQYAMNWAVRNSHNQEKETKEYAIQCIKYDHGVDDEKAEQEYQEFVEKSRKAKLMVKLDLFEMLPGGVSLLDELSTKGALENNYVLGRGGLTKEHMESNDQYLFDDEYSQEVPDKERPVFGIVDLYGQGLSVGSGTNYHGGNIALVLKDEVKNRATGCHLDSDNIPYGQEGKWVKPLTDPHQILIDRWRYKWRKPNKKNGQRQRAVESVLTGVPHKEDSNYFEAHIHGNIDLSKDVDHILMPASWAEDKRYKEAHKKIQDFCKLKNIEIKYE